MLLVSGMGRDDLQILMGAEPVWVARSHEFDQEHEGVRDEHENTMNTHK
jgi:hypothetical protein